MTFATHTSDLPSRQSKRLFAKSSNRNIVLSLSLALLSIAVYSPVRENAFINFDDPAYITRNPHVTSGLQWSTLQWAFTTFDAGNWHPLTWLSHALDCELFGLNPAGHHFVNVLLHAANAVLLFLVLQTLTGFPWRSFLVGALFAVHPLNVESVAWAAERKNVLSMFFFLLAVWAYVGYVRKPVLHRYAAVAGWFALGLMAKPQIITFPCLLLLLDLWPLGRLHLARPTGGDSSPVWQVIREKIPLLVLSGISAFITVVAQQSGRAIRTIAESALPLRIENSAVAYLRYLGKIFFPWRLAPIYPYPSSIATWEFVTATVVLAGITCAVVRYRRLGVLTTGWFWFVGSMVPMIGWVRVGEQAMADRYAYIPMIGVLLMAVWAVAEALQRTAAPRWIPILGCIVGIAVLSWITSRQIGYWKNSETLWTYTLSVTHKNYMAEDNLAQELAIQGRVDEAVLHFAAAEALHEYDSRQVLALAMYEQRNGHARDAIGQYQLVVQRATDPALRAAASANAGFAYLDLKDQTSAKESFEQALRLDPNNSAALLGTGLIAHKSGNVAKAIEQYSKAVAIHGDNVAYMLLGRALAQSGRAVEANAAYQRAEQLSQNSAATRRIVDGMLAP